MLREVADSRIGRRRGGQGHLLDCRRQRPENEGQGLSATVRPAEFLLHCNDGVQHPASSRRTARKAGLPRPGQLALGRLEVMLSGGTYSSERPSGKDGAVKSALNRREFNGLCGRYVHLWRRQARWLSMQRLPSL